VVDVTVPASKPKNSVQPACLFLHRFRIIPGVGTPIMKRREVGENCIMRSSITCTLREVYLE
jgi:hypothetical protein